MAYDSRELNGIGGWLAFFLVTLSVLTPIGGVVSLTRELYADPMVAANYGDRWPLLQGIEWGMLGCIVAIGWYLTWRLMRVQEWRSVRIAIIGLWVGATIPHIGELVAVSAISGVPLGRLVAAIGGALVQPLIYAAIWTAYQLRSDRVANTYSRYGIVEDEGELLAVFE